MIEQLLEFNEMFVREGKYHPYVCPKYPHKKLAILTCMDVRLTELLPAALGLKNGDVKLIRNAGAMVSSPFGSVMRSLLVAVYQLGVEEILVIGHSDCGMLHLDSEEMLAAMCNRGITEEKLGLVDDCGTDLRKWLSGFGSTEESVRETVGRIRRHPLMPVDVSVHGLVMDPETGKAECVK